MPPKPQKLSAFEQARLDNIKKNEELMRSLGIMGGSSSVAMPGDEPSREAKERLARERAAASRLASKEKRRMMKEMPVIPPDPDAPRRSSSRLSGVDPDPEATKRKREELELIENEQGEDHKRIRHGTRELNQLMGSGYKPAEAEELKRILSLPFTSSSTSTSTSTDPIKLETTSSEAKETSNGTGNGDLGVEGTEPRSEEKLSASRQELVEAISKMSLKSATKISSKRVYSMAMHPAKEKDLVFLGDKEGGVGIWDPTARSREEEAALKEEEEANATSQNQNQSSNFVGKSEDPDQKEDLDTDGNGLGDVKVESLPPAPVQEVSKGRSFHLQLHDRKPVTTIRFDPINPERMYTASYDASVRLLDLNSTPQISSNGATDPSSDLGIGSSTGGMANSGGESKILSTEIWAGYENVLLSIFEILAPTISANTFTETPQFGLDERSIWLADHRGGLIHLDLRIPYGVEGQYKRWNVSDKKIGGLSVNQKAPHCVAVGGIDQHVRLFDVRNLSTVPEYPEPPFNTSTIDKEAVKQAQDASEIASFDTGNAATSVDWSPRGEHLAACSYDNTVKIWNVHPSWLHKSTTGTSASLGAEAPATGRRSRSGIETKAEETKAEETTDETTQLDNGTGMKVPDPRDVLLTPIVVDHNNKTGKWLTAFRIKWHRDPNVEPHFALGSMDRTADIWSADGTILRSLSHPLMTAVPASAVFHPNRLGRLATGNASGYATFWA